MEELRQLIGGLTEEGHLDEADAQLLQGVFTLDERRAWEIMTPRTRVTAMREGQTAREALQATRETPGRLARPGDRLRLGPVRVRVLSTTDGGRIKRVLLAIGALATSPAL